jgi:hypothetical protein
MRRSACR